MMPLLSMQVMFILARFARAVLFPVGAPTGMVSWAMDLMRVLWCLWGLWVSMMLLL